MLITPLTRVLQNFWLFGKQQRMMTNLGMGMPSHFYTRAILECKHTSVFDSPVEAPIHALLKTMLPSCQNAVFTHDHQCAEQNPAFYFIKRFSGLTNENYGVIANQNKYVLRVSGCLDPDIDRKAEYESMQLFANQGYAQLPVYFDTSNGNMLRPYADGKDLHPGLLTGQLNQKIAKFMADFHHKTFPLPLSMTSLQRMEKLHHALIERNVKLPENYQNLYEKALIVEHKQQCLNLPLCVSHNDAHPGNFIQYPGDKMMLIDFENAAMSYPSWDVSYFGVFANLDVDAKLKFIDSYFGATKLEKLITRNNFKNSVIAYMPIVEFHGLLRLLLRAGNPNLLYKPKEIDDWVSIAVKNTCNAFSAEIIQEALHSLPVEPSFKPSYI